MLPAGPRSTQKLEYACEPPGSSTGCSPSPRHGEWVSVPAGAGDSVRAWVVYPERRDSAPVVVVVHEIFGLTHWVRSVADQLAADGFIAIAPDFLTGRGVPLGAGGEPERDAAVAAVRSLDAGDVHRRIEAAAAVRDGPPRRAGRVRRRGLLLGRHRRLRARRPRPRAPGRLGGVLRHLAGHVLAWPASARPVLGLYGENDARVNATIPPADSAMRALGRVYEHHLFRGAGHGFLRQQDGPGGRQPGGRPRRLAAHRALVPRAPGVGIDPWEPALALARANVEDAGLSDRIALHCATIQAFDDEHGFDLIWLPSFFIPASVLDEAFAQTRRLLRPDGALVVGVMEEPDDAVAAAVDAVITVRSGGAVLTAEQARDHLVSSGFTDVSEVDRTWNAPLRLVSAHG
jgi:carboxymethylenebutenolidase